MTGTLVGIFIDLLVFWAWSHPLFSRGQQMKMKLVGRDGLTIQKAWEAGPVQYIGLMIHGMPNMFHITGPGSPSVLTNSGFWTWPREAVFEVRVS